jgi:hypothetical protein
MDKIAISFSALYVLRVATVNFAVFGGGEQGHL